MPRPTLAYVHILGQELREAGLVIEDGWHEAEEWQTGEVAGTPLVTHHSPPLTEILSVMLERSDNLIAETVIRALGNKAAGEFSFEAGRGAARGVLMPLGVDLDRARYADGSGLSRYNHASPDQFCDLLLAMVRGGGRMADMWLDLLPTAGMDGTLAERFIGTPLAGNLAAKTGSMSSVKALSGYFTAASGERYAFSVLVNGYVADGSDVNAEIDRLLLVLYRQL
jgi:D-alanyl-D-alanine carboxypeptidase/D-alanyl-D-alanine-endopeptidase (penicillin-binding protein 4)